MVNDVISNAQTWTRNLNYRTKETENKDQPIVWVSHLATALKKSIKIPSWNDIPIRFAYKRPRTIGQILLNNKKLCKQSKLNSKEKPTYNSNICGKCKLCGHWGTSKNMVNVTSSITAEDGSRHKIRDQINCKDSGIYCASCNLCRNNYNKTRIYVGQTSQSFSERWNGHRSKYKSKNLNINNSKNSQKDQAALFAHVFEQHKGDLTKQLEEIFTVTFLQKSNNISIHILEDRWKHKLGASINLAKTITTDYKK